MALTANPVSWFEIPVTNMDRAKTFYENILDVELDINEMDNFVMAWFPMNEDSSGAAGTLIKADTYVPSYDGTMVYFAVDDIEAVLNRVKKKGGKVLNEKMSIGEHGFVGHFEDSEGNRVALHSKT